MGKAWMRFSSVRVRNGKADFTNENENGKWFEKEPRFQFTL
jgi:hypothetical protein